MCWATQYRRQFNREVRYQSTNQQTDRPAAQTGLTWVLVRFLSTCQMCAGTERGSVKLLCCVEIVLKSINEQFRSLAVERTLQME